MPPLPRRGAALSAALIVGAVSFGVFSPSVSGSPARSEALSATVRIRNAVPAAITDHTARLAGTVAGSKSLLLGFGLPLRHQVQLQQFISNDADHGRYLTQRQFDQRFAPKPAQTQRVVSWARSHGLGLLYASPDGLVITVRGSVSTVEHLMHVNIRRYAVDGKLVYAPASAPTVPRSLGIETVSGLDNIRHAVRIGLSRSAARKSDIPSDGLTPDTIRAAYNIAGYSVNGTPVDGTGETVGVTGFGEEVPDSDFQLFAENVGGSEICTTCADKLQWFELDGVTTDDPDIDEQALDVEYIHGLAPHVHIDYYLGDDGSDPGMEDAVAAAASNPSLRIVGNMWGDPGEESKSASNSFVIATQNSFEEAVAKGETFYFSTGDNAAASGCLNITASCVVPSYPADSPYTVAVGGTNLQLNSSLTAWQSEKTWNLGGGVLGSGGGCAPWFKRPSWQTGITGSPSCKGRAVPDISAAGDQANSPIEVWDDGSEFEAGGTSVSAALITGIAADTNRYLQLEHAIDSAVPASMGWAAPEIYKLANSPDYNADFHDVLCGSNTWPARQGWDQATGWGSINWYNFSRDYAGLGVTPVPPVATWNCTPSTGVQASLASIGCNPTYHCHLGAMNGVILNSTDAFHFTSPQSSVANQEIDGISCPGAQTCYATAINGWLHKTTNGGKTFISIKTGLTSASGVICKSKTSCLVVGNGIASTANGAHFTREADPATGLLVGISCSSKFCAALTAAGKIITSSNGGAWKLVKTTAPGGTISAVSCGSAGHCVAVGQESVANSSGGDALVYSTTNGTAWTPQPLPGDFGPLKSVSCSAASVCDAVGNSGDVLRTLNGATWAQVTAPDYAYNAIDCPTTHLCFAAATSGNFVQLGSSPGH